MSAANMESFIRSYSTLMLTMWRDDEERARLLADPTGYAAAAGLPVAPGSIVEVDTSACALPMSPEDVMADWSRTPGRHILHVPDASVAEHGELTETQLQSVAAGLLCVIEIV